MEMQTMNQIDFSSTFLQKVFFLNLISDWWKINVTLKIEQIQADLDQLNAEHLPRLEKLQQRVLSAVVESERSAFQLELEDKTREASLQSTRIHTKLDRTFFFGFLSLQKSKLN